MFNQAFKISYFAKFDYNLKRKHTSAYSNRVTDNYTIKVALENQFLHLKLFVFAEIIFKDVQDCNLKNDGLKVNSENSFYFAISNF